jgi:VCBS repeat-containing protein
MFTSLTRAARRPLALLSGVLLATSALIGAAAPATAQAPAPHWGQFEWNGGQTKVPVRAFVLFDRTGDPTTSAIVKYVSDWWNGQRVDHPELPYSSVYRDDANAGACFVNHTPGYSIASACRIRSLSTFGIQGISATFGDPHFVGGAFAVSDGLTLNEAFTTVCHNFGHVMGLADSVDDGSCMSHGLAPDQLRWYAPADMAAILALYQHDDGQAPVAVADGYSTAEDVALTVNAPGVLANDTDADGDALTATKVSDPAHGAVALNADGSFTYTPTANFAGTDSFTYKANDGTADSNVATATITVNPVNDAPVAVDDAYTTTQAVPVVVTAPGLLTNDSDVEGSPLTATGFGTASHGVVTGNADGSFTYAPEVTFTGTDSFTYDANDGTADSNVATVTITVQPAAG